MSQPENSQETPRKPPASAVERLAELYSVIDSPELRRACGDTLRACHGMRTSLCVKRGEWPTYDDVADVMAATAETLAAEVDTRIRARLQRGVK